MKEEFHSLHGAREREPAHNEDEHHEKEKRHKNLAYALDPLFDAEENDARRGAEEKKMRDDGLDRVGREPPEGFAHEGGIVRDAASEEGLDHVVHAPAAHDRIEGEHEKAREDRDEPDPPAGAPAPAAKGRRGACARGAPEAHFSDEKRQSEREREDDVGDQKDGAAVGAGHVGKFPDGAETHGRACARENETQTGIPNGTIGHEGISLLL